MSCTGYEVRKEYVDAFVKRVIPDIRKIMEAHDIKAVAVCGLSGVSWTALLTLHGIPVIHVRKKQDTDNHGAKIAYPERMHPYFREYGEDPNLNVLFLDDLIDSGRTRQWVIQSFEDTPQIKHHVTVVASLTLQFSNEPTFTLYPNRVHGLADYRYRS